MGIKIKKLTSSEQRVFRELKAKGTYIATVPSMKKTCEGLVAKGRAVAGDERPGRWVYRIAEEWAVRNYREFPGIMPDPPKPKKVRPPAEYSNCTTGTALVDQILKTSKRGK